MLTRMSLLWLRLLLLSAPYPLRYSLRGVIYLSVIEWVISALDTLLEVLVLGIVGLAIITMVKHRMGRREDV